MFLTTYIQGGLSILYATLIIIILLDAIRVCVRALQGKETPTAEASYQPSRLFAPSGLVPTPEERQVQEEWDRWLAEHPDDELASAGRAGISQPGGH